MAFEKAHFKSPKDPKQLFLIENQQNHPALSLRSPTERLDRASGRARAPPDPGPGPASGLEPGSGTPLGLRLELRPGLGPASGPARAPAPAPDPAPGPARARPGPPAGPRAGPGARPGPLRGLRRPKRALLGPWRGNSAILEIPRCPYRPLISYKIGGMPTKTPGG